MTDGEGFVYRTRLAWTRTALTFIGAGLAATRLLITGGASGVIWLAVEWLLVLMTLSAVAGYSFRRSAEKSVTDRLLLAQSGGLVALAVLALGGLLPN